MHPIERLRMVARAGREDPTVLGREAASALASFAGDPAALVTACRRLVSRQPTCGPVWWVAARVLNAADPAMEGWRAGDELARDRTGAALAYELPEDATVVALGRPEVVSDALLRRGDVRALVVDALDEGSSLVSALRRADNDASLVPESGLGPAVAAADVVIVDAVALGPGGLMAVSGSAAAAAVAARRGVPVWAVAATGRLLPEPLWDALAGVVARRQTPWDEPEELVPLAWVDVVVGPGGALPAAEAVASPTCPPAPELVRAVSR